MTEIHKTEMKIYSQACNDFNQEKDSYKRSHTQLAETLRNRNDLLDLIKSTIINESGE